ncbi:MAG: endolytic transglycosylase MltG [Bacteroidetes bacterium SB0662_bin_6]|nr:endolytic transglycosylase MltG [Bacteroidetes bacterium SB0668_bin_1]MYE04623.1 endolytic transglycosylase MltG [Bacteroidetes bacterium SB0662_bin_6]
MRRKVLIAQIVLVLTAGGMALLGVAAWVTVWSNTPDFEGSRTVRIPPGSEFEAVVDSLHANGILRRAGTLRLMARATGWGDQVKAGHYTFPAGVSNYDMLSVLRRGLQEPVRLTIPPGVRPEVAAAVAARNMFFSPDDFSAALADTQLAAAFGTDAAGLFGYMLPETYHFYWLSGAERAVRTITETFDAFFERELRAGADSLGLSKRDVATLASIIEWEALRPEEKPMIAGVYHNRLRIGMKLDADPTIQYIILQREGSKRRLLYSDYRIPHPFNTYLHGGLPPAPLNNPSASSLRAAVAPVRHDFLYFVATGDGTHHFSRTLTEHLRAARRYHALMRQRRAEQAAAEGEG